MSKQEIVNEFSKKQVLRSKQLVVKDKFIKQEIDALKINNSLENKDLENLNRILNELYQMGYLDCIFASADCVGGAINKLIENSESDSAGLKLGWILPNGQTVDLFYGNKNEKI